MSAGCIKILFEPDFGEIAQMEVYRARRGVFFDPPDPGGPDPPDPGSGVPGSGVPESRIRDPGISGGHISHHPSKTSCCIYSIHAYNRRAFCTRSLSHKRRYFDVNMQVPVTLFCVSFSWHLCLSLYYVSYLYMFLSFGILEFVCVDGVISIWPGRWS